MLVGVTFLCVKRDCVVNDAKNCTGIAHPCSRFDRGSACSSGSPIWRPNQLFDQHSASPATDLSNQCSSMLWPRWWWQGEMGTNNVRVWHPVLWCFKSIHSETSILVIGTGACWLDVCSACLAWQVFDFFSNFGVFLTTNGFLFLVVRPGSTSSSLLLIAMPFVTSSILCRIDSGSQARRSSWFHISASNKAKPKRRQGQSFCWRTCGVLFLLKMLK